MENLLENNTRSKMDVVCMIDTNLSANLNHRKRLMEEIVQVCATVNANLHPISVSFSSSIILSAVFVPRHPRNLVSILFLVREVGFWRNECRGYFLQCRRSYRGFVHSNPTKFAILPSWRSREFRNETKYSFV